MSKLIVCNYNNQVFTQRGNDGYVNATQMCKSVGRNFSTWYRSDSTNAFLKSLSKSTHIPIEEGSVQICMDVMEAIEKKVISNQQYLVNFIKEGDNSQRGTWIHPKVAINLAQWASPDFAVLVTDVVFNWMSKLSKQYDSTQMDTIMQLADRKRANARSVPRGYFSIFGETERIIWTFMDCNMPVNHEIIPDISMGIHWSKYWLSNDLDTKYRTRVSYTHRYPQHYNQSKVNQEAFAYPNESWPEFQIWVEEDYLPRQFVKYLKEKVVKKKLQREKHNAILESLQVNVKGNLLD